MPVYLETPSGLVPVLHHIGYRVFETFYDRDTLERKLEECAGQVDKMNMGIGMELDGYCAWSVYSCMFRGPSTYFDDNSDRETKAVTLDEACRKLQVSCEVFSNECGCAFAEHYLINALGEILVNDCVDYEEYYIGEYETWEDLLADWKYDNLPHKEDFEKAKELNMDSYGICQYTPHPGDELPWVLNSQAFF